MSHFDQEPRASAATEMRALLAKVGIELEAQTKQFAFVTRLDFLIQFSVVAAIFVVVMTLLGNAWVGVFLVMLIGGLLVALRWIQMKGVLDAIEKIREIVR